MGTVLPGQAYQRVVEGLEPGVRPCHDQQTATLRRPLPLPTRRGPKPAQGQQATTPHMSAHTNGATRPVSWLLAGATAMAAAHQPQSRGSISIRVTGTAQSVDLLLADTGNIALTSLGNHTDARSHPMRVVPMRLDMLSDLPAIHVSGRGVTEPTQPAHRHHVGDDVRIRFRSPR